MNAFTLIWNRELQRAMHDSLILMNLPELYVCHIFHSSLRFLTSFSSSLVSIFPFRMPLRVSFLCLMKIPSPESNIRTLSPSFRWYFFLKSFGSVIWPFELTVHFLTICYIILCTYKCYTLHNEFCIYFITVWVLLTHAMWFTGWLNPTVSGFGWFFLHTDFSNLVGIRLNRRIVRFCAVFTQSNSNREFPNFKLWPPLLSQSSGSSRFIDRVQTPIPPHELRCQRHCLRAGWLWTYRSPET